MGAFFVCAQRKKRPQALCAQRLPNGKTRGLPPAAAEIGQSLATCGRRLSMSPTTWSDAPLTTAIVHVFRGYAGRYSHPPLPRDDLVASRKEDDCASRYAATRVPRAGNFRK
ncbi:hypothetical protein AGR4C_Cc80131 [Agrobacterium tumefaciens str. Kerr 14]|uniref:Uncharacterized protein n=1 Tax=Agrobacterium tumefaciens str. Kerr 14 TaxID=1183424 RepID=A0A1S7QIN1_AGRTU|nr:hypothetical protein AGR4C_Cc80131 [Agrobacterium tumefaciens str. Kerr 14]